MLKSLTRPFMLFFSEPILQVLGIYMAFIYGVFYRTSLFLLCPSLPLSLPLLPPLPLFPIIFVTCKP